jgi:hypothetical protein
MKTTKYQRLASVFITTLVFSLIVNFFSTWVNAHDPYKSMSFSQKNSLYLFWSSVAVLVVTGIAYGLDPKSDERF